MASNISKNLLAASTFITSPNNALATLDVYTKSNSSIVNKIQDIALKFDPDIANILKGGSYISSQFPVIEKTASQLLTVNQDNLIARISAISKPISSSIKSLTSGFTQGVQNLAKSIGIPDDVSVLVNDIAMKVRGVDFQNLQSIAGLIQEVSGNSNAFTVNDQAAFSGLVIGIAQEATNNGIPNSLDALAPAITSQGVMNDVVSNLLPVILQNSDVRMLKTLVDNDSSNYTRLLDQTYIEQFIKGYKFGFGFDEGEENTEFRMMMDCFDRIDPDWDKKTILENTAQYEAIDLTKIVDGSKDFQSGLIQDIMINNPGAITDDPDEIFMALSTVFKPTDVYTEIKTLLPYNVISEGNNNTTDPQTPLVQN